MRPLLLLLACGHAASPPANAPIAGHLADGGVAQIAITDGKIAALAPATGDAWLWPPVIDSHVHVSYYPVADQLAEAGVEGVVDLAAPERTLGQASPIDVIAAGPMLTQDGGYPLNAWGADGYGIGCHDDACVTQAIDRLAREGAKVIKLALDEDGLPPRLARTAVAAAHAHHLKVAAHALSDNAARVAGLAGVDVLAHTPVEPLSDATIEAWRGRAVISTLAAFGGSRATVRNLARLRAAGCTVLYGTDLGNTHDAGPSADEIALLHEAGLDDAAIVAAMTTVPVAFWGFDYGVAVGKPATFVVLDRDPRTDARAFLSPAAVYRSGRRVWPR